MAISSTRARQGVDLRVAGDHLVGQAFPALQQRGGGVLHGGGRGRGHVGEEQRQVGELTGQRVGGSHRERAGHPTGDDVDDPAGDRDGVVGVALVEAGEQGDVDGGLDAVAPVAVHQHGEHVLVEVVHGVVVATPARRPSRGRGSG